MEVPWLGVELELQLPAYTRARATATATEDLRGTPINNVLKTKPGVPIVAQWK